MKKNLFLLLLTLTIVSSLVAGTMATYTKTLEPLKGSATAKQFYIGSTETAFPKIKLAPTESTVWKFGVINYRNDVPTEVDMDLDIIVNLGAAENRAEIDGLTLGLYEGETQLGTTIIRNGTIEVTLPKAFAANVKAQRDFSLRLLWLNGAVSDATDTLNADHFNTSKISVTVTGRQSIASDEPEITPDKLSGSGTEKNPYEVALPQHLALIGTKNYTTDKYYRQTANIDMTGIASSPIGTMSEQFSGVYDGNGYFISNIEFGYVEEWFGAEKYKCYGLFGIIGEKGLVKSVILKNSTTYAKAFGNDFIAFGSIAGVNFGTISKSHNYINFNFSNSENINRMQNIAGICGRNEGRIEYCSNRGKISYNNSQTSMGSQFNAAGIAAYSKNQSEIVYCFNVADITISFSKKPNGTTINAGGILSGYDNTSGNLISNCYNTSNVYGMAYRVRSGGIIAYNGVSSDVSIDGCYMLGTANGSASTGAGRLLIGAIAGYSNSACIANCDNSKKKDILYPGFSAEVWFIDSASGYNYPQLYNNAHQ